jgi:hypothetical protein
MGEMSRGFVIDVTGSEGHGGAVPARASTLRCDAEEQDAAILRAWGAAVLRPYTKGYAISGGKTLWSGGASPAPTRKSEMAT